MFHRRFSTQQSLYIIIFTCWVLPLLGTVLWFSTQQEDSVRLRTEESVTASVEYALGEMTRRLEDSLTDSRSASYDGTISSAYKTYLLDGSAVQLYSTTSSYLNTEYGYNNLFDGALLVYWAEPDTPVLINRTGLENRTERMREISEVGQGQLMALAQDVGNNAVFQMVDGTLYLVRNLVDAHYEPYATLILPFQMSYLMEASESIVWAESVALSINDMYIPVMGDPQPLEQLDLTYNTEGDHFSLGAVEELESNQISIEVTVYGDFLQGEQAGIFQTLITVVILSGVLFVMIIHYVYHNISQPVKNLLEGSRRLSQGELGYQIETLPNGEEFFQLTQHFNELSNQLDQLFTHHTQEQQDLADAKVKALQSQINPHFMNNTLEMINWQARMAGNDKVCDMISALSVMLNAAMGRGGTATVTMKQEYTYIEAYLFIISHRFGSRLQVKIDIEDGVWQAMVPRLCLQPIVENAVEHGVALRTSGEVSIHIYVVEDILTIDVQHEGDISEKDRKTIDQLLSWDGTENSEQCSVRIGIRNVQHRLKMLCGEESNLSVEEYEQGWVRSRMVLPLILQNNGDNE